MPSTRIPQFSPEAPSQADNASPFVHRLIISAVPLLLLTVAACQFYFVHTARLSPWKGGGFGMFSSVDSIDARVVQAFVTVDGQEFPVRLDGPLVELRDRVKAQPIARHGDELVRQMLAAGWDPPGMYVTAVDEGIQQAWPAWSPATHRPHGTLANAGGGRLPEAVRIDVRRTTFYAESNELATQSLLTADAQRSR